MTTSETYLETRKILPATIAAHHLEFDAAPTAERIIDRLAAALYRLAEAAQPTILLDEFDNAEQIKDLTQLLNAGYDANRVAIRCNADKGTVERFRTFCPKVIASIRHLAETTESRSLPIDLQRVPADAERSLTELCDIDPAVFLAVKRKILAWVEDNLDRIKTTRPERPDWLKTRDWDIWRPLFTVAAVMGGTAPALALQAATGVSKDRVVEQSLAIEILSNIREMARQATGVGLVEREANDEVFLPSQNIFATPRRRHRGRTGRPETSRD
jgi:hypothetical protein